MSITIGDVGERVSQIPHSILEWFADLFCKLGLGEGCSIKNWTELTLGQAALIVFLIWAISVGVWKDLLEKNGKAVAIAKIISIPVGVAVSGAFAAIEIYVLSRMEGNVGDYVPYFFAEIVIYVVLIFTPVFVGMFVCDRIHALIKSYVEDERL